MEKYILENGRDPMTGDTLTTSDLVAVQASSITRPLDVSNMTIPGLLGTLQNEWDEVMLEMFSLKQNLDTTRRELSQALYQHDAACRVIARLMRERDEARALLTGGGGNGNMASESTAMDTEDGDGSGWDSILVEMSEMNVALQAERKQKKGSKDFKPAEDTTNICIQNTFTANKKANLQSTHYNEANSKFVCGGDDGTICGLSSDGKSIFKVSNAHDNPITSIAWLSEFSFVSCDGASIKTWSRGEGKKESYSNDATIDTSSYGPKVVGMHAHPSNKYVFTCHENGQWNCFSLGSQECVHSFQTKSDASTSDLHPDGMLLGIGTNEGKVLVCDIKLRDTSGIVVVGEDSVPITCCKFSSNGYHLATLNASGVCRVWDLRKMKCLHTSATSGDMTGGALAFDHIGQYIAFSTANKTIEVHTVKDWKHMASVDGKFSHDIVQLSWNGVSNSSSVVSTTGGQLIVMT